MCGIAGTVGYKENWECLDMLEHQDKRGPDNSFWKSVWPDVFLGHNRLSIIDLSEKGNQPLSLGPHHLTYNGEIYNYKDLQSKINCAQSYDDSGAAVGIEGNDAVTLLHYIANFGLERAMKDANGMYAYCYFDAEKQQIHLVVDRFGQKPLYYYHSGASFAFASSVGALMQLRDKWEIDEEGLQSYWLLGATMGETSIIRGIKRIIGSHHLTYDIRKNKVSIERYWTPQFQENTSGIEDLVLDAINKVKISDVPVYTFLSGGIDSTLVASQMKGMNAVHLDGPELKYALEVAEKFGMNLITVDPLTIDVEDCLKDYAFQVGEPSMAALIPYITAKEVHNLGAKVAISANGADELFFGYDRIFEDVEVKQTHHIFRASLSLGGGFDLPEVVLKSRRNSLTKEWFRGGRWLELQSYIQYDLNKTLDAASMCHSLEVRSPFLDHRLVEMALSIPEGKHISPRLGRKTILKTMLFKMGFSNEFLTRPKLGFSLHREPEGMEDLKTDAWKFVKENGFLKCDDSKLNGRDERYLKMSALSFWVWYKAWEHKL